MNGKFFLFLIILICFIVSSNFASSLSIDFSSTSPQESCITLTNAKGFLYNNTYGKSWRFIRQGGEFILQFSIGGNPQDAIMDIIHLTSAYGNARGGGYSPIDIIINGKTFVSSYDPAEHHNGSHGFVEDSWAIGQLLRQGNNMIRFHLGDNAQTHYWIQNLMIRGIKEEQRTQKEIIKSRDLSDDEKIEYYRKWRKDYEDALTRAYDPNLPGAKITFGFVKESMADASASQKYNMELVQEGKDLLFEKTIRRKSPAEQLVARTIYKTTGNRTTFGLRTLAALISSGSTLAPMIAVDVGHSTAETLESQGLLNREQANVMKGLFTLADAVYGIKDHDSLLRAIQFANKSLKGIAEILSENDDPEGKELYAIIRSGNEIMRVIVSYSEK